MYARNQLIVLVSAAVAAVVGVSAVALASATGRPPVLAAQTASPAAPRAGETKPSLQTPLGAEAVETLRRLARCMREQGLREYPDPSANGDLALPEAYLHPNAELKARLDSAGGACKRSVTR